MTDRHQRRIGPHQAAPARAFTLVEMMAVILVISIVVAVVVGVAGNAISKAAEEKTKESMAVIMTAVDAYHDAKGVWPPVTGGSPTARSNRLFRELKACAESKERLAAFTSDTLKGGKFLDGFEQVIDYHPTGGAGGTPYLESAGRDGDFDSKEDNIRSDNM